MIGLTLEGGGVKGAFQVGALKALIEQNIQFKGVFGTSIGALNGAMFAQNTFDDCYLLWEQANFSMFLDFENDLLDKLEEKNLSLKELGEIILYTIGKKGIPIESLINLVDYHVDENKLRTSDVLFGCVSINISQGWEPLELFTDEMPPGSIKNYLVASAYHPTFNRKEIDGSSYIDGGLYNNLPINPLIRRGFNEIYVIRTMSKMPHQPVIDKSVKIHLIEPSEDLGKSYDFTMSNINFLMKLGYYDAVSYLNSFIGSKFYINNSDPAWGNMFVDAFKNWYLTQDSQSSYQVYLVELADFLKIPVLTSTLSILVSYLEELALSQKLEKFEIYSLKNFFKQIQDRLIINENSSTLEQFIKNYNI